MLFPVKSNGIWISAAIAVLIAMLMLNPTAEQHRTAFTQSAEARFFDLSPQQRQIFQKVRSETLKGKDPGELEYVNLYLFSVLNHVEQSPAQTGHHPKRRLLSLGALQVIVPLAP